MNLLPLQLRAQVTTGDCLRVLRKMPDACVDLVFTSTPYEDQRTYGRDYRLRRMAWLAQWLPVFHQCLRVSRGPVCFVLNNTHQAGHESLVVERLKVALEEAEAFVHPSWLFERYSTPGARPYVRDILETVVVASRVWPLPTLHNTAAGGPPRHQRGGNFSHRTAKGKRVQGKAYPQPEQCMATNVVRGLVGGGHLAPSREQSKLAEQNEAPFPEWLVNPFLLTFTNPGDVVLDPCCGSGTTLAAARRLDRVGVGIDLRADQARLTRKRLAALDKELAAA